MKLHSACCLAHGSWRRYSHHRCNSIQLDEKTAKTIEAAAIVAGVSISDFVSSLVASKMNVSSRGSWEAIEKQFVDLSVDANSVGAFPRSDIYADHD